MEKGGNWALVLAAGQGKRIGTDVPKQFLPVGGKPLLFYSLQTFQDLTEIDGILVVADNSYKDLIMNSGFNKIKGLTEGGAERYLSVCCGLRALQAMQPDYVLIHDGARPFADAGLILRTLDGAKKYGAAAAAIPVSDTIRVADRDGFGAKTPDRRTLFAMQTPQTFAFLPILNAYEELLDHPEFLPVTDDAEVLQKVKGQKTYLSQGSPKNRKITNPEDLELLKTISL